jgi:hypothetical protein
LLDGAADADADRGTACADSASARDGSAGVWRPGGLLLLPTGPSNARMATGARCDWSCAAIVDSELGLHIAAFAWPAYNSTNLRSRAHIKKVACQR